MADLPNYQVYAIRYAPRGARRAENSIGGDPHDGPMPLAYYVGAIVGAERSFVVDTGFNEAVAKKRNRDFLHCPISSLELIGIDPKTVSDVILTHLHYDHVGNFDLLPAATFHLQETELHYAVGRRYMRYKRLRHSYEIDDVVGMARANYAGRTRERRSWGPASRSIPRRGYSAGLQYVRVRTARGWVVLASDVTHFYENMVSVAPMSPPSISARCWRAMTSYSPPRPRATISFPGTIRW